MDNEKKYNEALERAKKWEREHPHGYVIKDMMEYIFPELAESEDERITRAINNMLPFIPDEAYANNGVTKEGVLNWLEKQKEQKPAEWSDEDEKMIERLITRLNWITNNTRTDGTSPNITFFDEIDWLKSLRPQPKVELSEDVKKTLDEVSHILVGLNYKQIAKDYKQAVEKLLSLRPSWKPTEVCYGEKGDPDPAGVWKPSKEQMTNLLRAEGRLRIEGESVLASKLAELYEQLKKYSDGKN